MRKTALAKTVENEAEAPELAQLRARIARIIQDEYSGDACSEFWLRPARRAAERIMEAIASLCRVNLLSPRISRASEIETSSPSSPSRSKLLEPLASASIRQPHTQAISGRSSLDAKRRSASVNVLPAGAGTQRSGSRRR